MSRKILVCTGLSVLLLLYFIAPTVGCVGARPMAMGGAFIGVADDINALYWNSSGLARLTSIQSTYTRTLGTSRANINYDDFAGVAGPLPLEAGEIDLVYGVSYIKSSTAIWDYDKVGLTLAAGFGDFALGYNINYMDAEAGGNSDDDVGVDLSFTYWFDERITFGVLIQDFIQTEVFNTEFIRNVRPGASYRLTEDILISAEIYALNEVDFREYQFGIEYRMPAYQEVTLRAGNYQGAFKTFGVGLLVTENVSVDLAYLDDNNNQIRQLGISAFF